MIPFLLPVVNPRFLNCSLHYRWIYLSQRQRFHCLVNYSLFMHFHQCLFNQLYPFFQGLIILKEFSYFSYSISSWIAEFSQILKITPHHWYHRYWKLIQAILSAMHSENLSPKLIPLLSSYHKICLGNTRLRKPPPTYVKKNQILFFCIFTSDLKVFSFKRIAIILLP